MAEGDSQDKRHAPTERRLRQAADKGQMELYLRWLEKHEMQPGEEPPWG